MLNNMCSIFPVYPELPLCFILIQSISTHTKARPKNKIDYFYQLWSTTLFLCFPDISSYHRSQGS